MADILETFLNVVAPLLLGPILIELGISRIQKRSYAWPSWWAIVLIGMGVKYILK